MLAIENFIGKVHPGDCVETLKKIPSESIDLIVTDPPYLTSYCSNLRRVEFKKSESKPVFDGAPEPITHDFGTEIKGDDDGEEDNSKVLLAAFDEMQRIMKPNTAIYAFCNSVHVEFFKMAMDARFNFKNIIVWVKNGFSAGDLTGAFARQHEFIIMANKGQAKFRGDRITDVWHIDRVSGNDQLHQNQKPLALLKIAILKHSDEGDIVLDPFSGSGSTLAAAKELGRRWIGCEIEERYCDVINTRLSGTGHQQELF